MTNSDAKGKAYERKISKLLSEWCGFELIRTPMSGGWQGTAGDIIPKNRSQHFPFVVECKNRKASAWSMEQILAGNGQFPDWVFQCEQEIIKDNENGHPVSTFLLIFTRNNKPDYIALPTAYMPVLHMNYAIIHTVTPVVVCELKQFLLFVDYDKLISMVEQRSA